MTDNDTSLSLFPIFLCEAPHIPFLQLLYTLKRSTALLCHVFLDDSIPRLFQSILHTIGISSIYYLIAVIFRYPSVYLSKLVVLVVFVDKQEMADASYLDDIPAYLERKYNIQRQLGFGSYGTVFLALQKSTKKQYVIDDVL